MARKRKAVGFYRDEKGRTRPITKKNVAGALASGVRVRRVRRKAAKTEKTKLENDKYLKYDKDVDWYSPKPNLVRGGIKWGFDLTDVRSRRAWNGFLRKHGFVKVAEAPKARYGSKPVVYRNPSGLFIVVDCETPVKERRRLVLGYMRFEAPRGKRRELMRVLSDFRGPEILEGWDVQGGDLGGIAVYVKEETPNRAPFI